MRPWRTWRCCGGSSGRAWPARSSAPDGGSGSTPSSAAPSRSPSSTTCPVTRSPFRLALLLVMPPFLLWLLGREFMRLCGGFAGIFASLAALMFNCVDKDAIGNDYYSSYGDDSEWRSDCCSIRHQLIELISEFKLLPINQRIGY